MNCLLWFTGKMDEMLDKNSFKTGWKSLSFKWLLYRLRQETKELKQELNKKPMNFDKVIKESADVANFAMMLADNARDCKEIEEEEMGVHHHAR